MYQIPEPTQADYPGAALPDKSLYSFDKIRKSMKKPNKKKLMGHEPEDEA